MFHPLQALKFKLGVVTTGNSLDHVEADDAQMAANGAYPNSIVTRDAAQPCPSFLKSTSLITFRSFLPDASVKDMEAAAVAWAAELYAVPYFALKVVTDIGTYMSLH